MSKESKIEDLNFEASLKELEEIVERLENGQGSLEDAISAYERGSLLKKHCQAKLDEARLKVEKIRLPDNVSSIMSRVHKLIDRKSVV